MKNIDDIFDKEIEKEFHRPLEIPEGLSESSIVNMLKENKVRPKKTFPVRAVAKVLSAAAAFVLITVAAFYISLDSEFVTVKPDEKEISSGEAKFECLTGENGSPLSLKIPKSEDDLKNLFIKDYAENKAEDIAYNFRFGYYTEDKAASDVVMDNMAPTTAPTAAPMAQATGSPEYAGTNVQVQGVDEGDVIKNDGRYIYSVNSHYNVSGEWGSVLTITDTVSMKRLYSGSIKLKKKNKYTRIHDIYVRGDFLTAICSYNSKTCIVVYDITDRSNPKEIRRVSQDGSYTSSRMTGDIIYTVTEHYVMGESLKEVKEKAIPCIDGKYMPYDMCYVADEKSKVYTVLTAFETEKTDSEVSSVSVLGYTDNVYCTADTLYVYGYDYDSKSQTESTVIYSFSIDGTVFKQKASGRVKGTTVNQYSLDEYKGYLRIATTYYDYKNNTDVSGVYVFDENLVKVGQVTDIAHDEQVKSVRFMGDTGYVVTFRNTDPLFIIDFSDPEYPVVTGELKIPGYSAYLHMLDEKYLLGIGYNGDDENADMNSVKISVFDVSNKTAPVITDSMVIEKATSLVNTNPKAFLYYESRDTVYIPVTHNRDSRQVKSLQSVKVINGKIKSHYGFVHGAEDYSVTGFYGKFYFYDDLFRGTYIGDKLYTLDNYTIVEHNLDTGEKERECVLYEKSEQTVNESPLVDSTEYILVD